MHRNQELVGIEFGTINERILNLEQSMKGTHDILILQMGIFLVESESTAENGLFYIC
jgi:hypothetical protein